MVDRRDCSGAEPGCQRRRWHPCSLKLDARGVCMAYSTQQRTHSSGEDMAALWQVSFAVTCIVLLLPISTGAEVVRLEVEWREDVLRGKPFDAVGPYEKLSGRVYFRFDPASPMNARITDLDKAPRNAEGRVEASANFMALRPKHQAKEQRIALLEV